MVLFSVGFLVPEDFAVDCKGLFVINTVYALLFELVYGVSLSPEDGFLAAFL